MTVKQLINKLSKFDENMRVVVSEGDHNFRPPYLTKDDDYPGYPEDMMPEVVLVIS